MLRERHGYRSPLSISVMILSLMLLTAADLGSKEWALDNLSEPRASADAAAVCVPDEHGRIAHQRRATASRPLIDGVLNLSYTENCGAAFSMLRTAPGWLRLLVFGTASVGATVILIAMYVRGAGGPLFAAAVPLIVSGAVGNNLSDRPRHGFVVDFLQVDPELFNYPIFNVADIWIAIGVGLLLIDGFASRNKQTVAQPTPVPAGSKVKPQ